MPPDIAETLSNTALIKDPEQSSGGSVAPEAPGAPEAPQPPEPPESGYKTNDDQGLENLIQGTGGQEQQPAQDNGQ